MPLAPVDRIELAACYLLLTLALFALALVLAFSRISRIEHLEFIAQMRRRLDALNPRSAEDRRFFDQGQNEHSFDRRFNAERRSPK